MPDTMKAALLRAFGQPLELDTLPVPQPGPGEVLVQTRVCGIDGTDLKLLNGFGYTPTLPFVMGHEIAGVISAVGEGVTGFQVGDRVIVYNFVICGQCPYCLTYREQLCTAMGGVMGVLNVHGGYPGYVRGPAPQLFPLPRQVDWA